ncbi:uncharacterized protein LOC126906365 [Daktulosphaira vitifoliae]|uniref:uncharacterized protein LOC126906365 n=1 Tax=Daktulosphaira vitifoliae TaxID=58002 RepID=UPI0021AADB46|nr:uncharacterized protein LOC126906365 [Daktulosphaira vitifoliae]
MKNIILLTVLVLFITIYYLILDNIIFQRQQEIIERCSTSGPSTSQSESVSVDQSGYESSASSSDSIIQTPLYLSNNTPRKLKLKTKLQFETRKFKEMGVQNGFFLH